MERERITPAELRLVRRYSQSRAVDRYKKGLYSGPILMGTMSIAVSILLPFLILGLAHKIDGSRFLPANWGPDTLGAIRASFSLSELITVNIVLVSVAAFVFNVLRKSNNAKLVGNEQVRDYAFQQSLPVVGNIVTMFSIIITGYSYFIFERVGSAVCMTILSVVIIAILGPLKHDISGLWLTRRYIDARHTRYRLYLTHRSNRYWLIARSDRKSRAVGSALVILGFSLTSSLLALVVVTPWAALVCALWFVFLYPVVRLNGDIFSSECVVSGRGIAKALRLMSLFVAPRTLGSIVIAMVPGIVAIGLIAEGHYSWGAFFGAMFATTVIYLYQNRFAVLVCNGLQRYPHRGDYQRVWKANSSAAKIIHFLFLAPFQSRARREYRSIRRLVDRSIEILIEKEKVAKRE